MGCSAQATSPVNITVSKATQFVRALCILHNSCIDEKEPIASLPPSEDVLPGMVSGGFAHDDAGSCPEPLMDTGHHFDDAKGNRFVLGTTSGTHY
jgi:hypothetical protein